MTFREIPQTLFNQFGEAESLRPGPALVVSQQMVFKGCDALLNYYSIDVQPRFAFSGLAVYRSQHQLEKPWGAPLFIIDTIMKSVDWEQGKGRLYRACIAYKLESTSSFQNHVLDTQILRLARRAIVLQRQAVREEFWECEMFPEGDYFRRPDPDD